MHAKYLIIAALLLAAAATADKVVIVATFPHYHLVLREAFPDAEVRLLVPPGIDPHHYQLRPEDLDLLKRLRPTDVIVNSMHASFELKIAEMAEKGEIKAKHIDVTKFSRYLTWDGRLVKIEPHEHHDHKHKDEHHGVNMHEHGAYPPNVLKLIEEVSKATGLKPSEAFLAELRKLNATYGGKFRGKAVALTPLSQYILQWLGFDDVAVFIKEPGVPPSPEDLKKALEYARQGAPVLAFGGAADRAQRLADDFSKKAAEAGIQVKPIVVGLDQGGYLAALKKTAQEIEKLNPPTRQTPATQPAPATQQQTGPSTKQQTGTELAAVLVAVVVAAIVGALLLLKKKGASKSK